MAARLGRAGLWFATAATGGVAVVAPAAAATSIPRAPVGGTPSTPAVVVRLQDSAITESSGLVVGTACPGVLWTHNDGGAVADVYGVDARTGRTVARIRLRGIDPYDPEALASGRDEAGRPALFLGDIGDNSLRRSDISVFRVPEPARGGSAVLSPTWWHLTYPDGPHDAEALLVDPRDGRVYVATKDLLGGGLYVAPRRLRTDQPNPLRRIVDVPSLVTDGAFLPDGSFLLRTYVDLHVYDRPGHEVARLPLPAQQQGESLAVEPGGRSVLVGSEGRDSPVYRVDLTDVPLARSSSGTSAVASAPPDARDDSALEGRATGWLLSGGLLAVAAAAAGSLALRRRRS